MTKKQRNGQDNSNHDAFSTFCFLRIVQFYYDYDLNVM